MNKASDSLEQLWDDLLSRQPGQIQQAYDRLDPLSQQTVLSHLNHMVKDSGWQSEQRQSASAALQALQGRIDQEE